MCWLVEDFFTIGPAVVTADGQIFAVNAAEGGTLLDIRLPATVCALFEDELHCNSNHQCIFCSNETSCHEVLDELPDG